MSTIAFAIKCDPADRSRFQAIQKAEEKTAPVLFKQLLDEHTPGAPVKTIETSDNQQLNQGTIDELQKLAAEIVALRSEKTELQNRVQELENQPNPALPSTTHLSVVTPPAFVFTPTEVQAKTMQRNIAYLVKKGKLTRENPGDLPRQFAGLALDYFNKHAFSF